MTNTALHRSIEESPHHMAMTSTLSPSHFQARQFSTSFMSHTDRIELCTYHVELWSECSASLAHRFTTRQAALSSQQQAMTRPSSSPHDD